MQRRGEDVLFAAVLRRGDALADKAAVLPRGLPHLLRHLHAERGRSRPRSRRVPERPGGAAKIFGAEDRRGEGGGELSALSRLFAVHGGVSARPRPAPLPDAGRVARGDHRRDGRARQRHVQRQALTDPRRGAGVLRDRGFPRGRPAARVPRAPGAEALSSAAGGVRDGRAAGAPGLPGGAAIDDAVADDEEREGGGAGEAGGGGA